MCIFNQPKPPKPEKPKPADQGASEDLRRRIAGFAGANTKSSALGVPGYSGGATASLSAG